MTDRTLSSWRASRPADAAMFAVRMEQGREDPHGGALDDTVGADQREDAALVHIQVDVVEDDAARRRTCACRSPSAPGRPRVRHAPPCPPLPTVERRITTDRRSV